MGLLEMAEFEKFVVRAKSKGYAGGGEYVKSLVFPGMKMFRYIEEEGDFSYMDCYYGFDPFSGYEVVWHKGLWPIWMMTYYGGIAWEVASQFCLPEHCRSFAKEIYDFLKNARLNIYNQGSFLGPDQQGTHYYLEQRTGGQYDYWDKYSGDIQRFGGTETILFRLDTVVYRLVYNGGLLGR